MFELTGLQYLEIGIGLLVLIVLVVFRDHIVDIGEIVWSHKKLTLIVIIVVFVVYVAMTYKPPPPPLPEPVFINNITQIGYKWPGS